MAANFADVSGNKKSKLIPNALPSSAASNLE
jgi:hypothetical protein